MSDEISIVCPRCDHEWKVSLQDLEIFDEGVYREVCPHDGVFIFVEVDGEQASPKIVSMREETDEERKLRERLEEAALLLEKAQAALANDELDRAQAHYQENLQLLEKTGMADKAFGKQGRAVSLSNLAQISLTRGDLDISLSLYQESLKLYEQLSASDDDFGKRGQANVLSQLANIYWEKEDSEHAQHLLEQAIELGKQVRDLEGIAYDTTKLGQLSQARGDLDSALAHYREGLGIFEQLEAQPKIAELRQMIAGIEDILSQTPSPESIAGNLSQLIAKAQNDVERGDIRSAIENQEQAVALAKDLLNQKALIVQMVILAQYYAMNERFKEAISVLEESIQAGESINYPELNTIRQLHKTLSSVAALPPEEQAAIREERQQAQIVKTADQARDAGLAYARKQAPKRDVLNLLEDAARRMKEDESAGSSRFEVASLCEALAALIKNESIPSVPAGYASHFSAVQNEIKK